MCIVEVEVLLQKQCSSSINSRITIVVAIADIVETANFAWSHLYIGYFLFIPTTTKTTTTANHSNVDLGFDSDMVVVDNAVDATKDATQVFPWEIFLKSHPL
jgi:hypothetical protein